MATLNKSALDAIVQSNIDSLVANTEPEDVLFAAFSGGKLFPGRCSVQAASELPDPTTGTIPDGTLVYVDAINIPVIKSDCRWIALDGRTFSGNLGEILSWGAGACGQLGNGTETLNNASPVQELCSATNWYDVASGGLHTLAIKTDGTLWAWGRNCALTLGDGTGIQKCSPVQEFCSATNWCKASGSFVTSIAIKTNGTLWSWGLGNCGRLGRGNVSNTTSPVQEISSSTDWCITSAGTNHTTALKTNSTLWAWGQGACGALGDNTVVDKCSPIQEITSSTNWNVVSAGTFHTSAVKSDGTIWAWGLNTSGQLGDGTIVVKSSPVQEITSSTTWCAVSAGNANSSALKINGTLWSWGTGSNGILGDGTVANKCSPVQEISSSTNWSDVSTNQRSSHVVAIKTDGTLWSWGGGFHGQLGDGTCTNRCSPVREISSSTEWGKASAGECHTVALKTTLFQVV